MAVGDVGDGDFAEGILPLGAAGDAPRGVADAVGRGEIVLGLRFDELGDESVDGGLIAVGEEHRAGAGAEGVDQAGAVVFLILARLLVFFDEVGVVVLDVAGGDEAALHVGAHLLLVEVEAGLGLADEGAGLLELEEIGVGLGVNGVAVVIGFRRQIDLCAVNVEEAVRFAGGEGGGLGRIDDIVGHAGNFRREGRGGNKTLEGANTHRSAHGDKGAGRRQAAGRASCAGGAPGRPARRRFPATKNPRLVTGGGRGGEARLIWRLWCRYHDGTSW